MTTQEWERCGLPVVERCKREILADIATGRVPATVRSFGELHNYVDANEYGGACEGEWTDETLDTVCEFWGRVQDTVDAWLRTGLFMHGAMTTQR